MAGADDDPDALRARASSLGGAARGLADLSEKYRLLRELASGVPGRTTERRDAMRRIAARFPGALREWDEASAADLAARQAEVDALLARVAAAGSAALAEQIVRDAAPGWLRYALILHPLLGELLAAKRWLAGAQGGDESAFRARFPGLSRADIAAPPGGRLTALAYAKVAETFCVSVDEVKAALFEFDHEMADDSGGD